LYQVEQDTHWPAIDKYIARQFPEYFYNQAIFILAWTIDFVWKIQKYSYFSELIRYSLRINSHMRKQIRIYTSRKADWNLQASLLLPHALCRNHITAPNIIFQNMTRNAWRWHLIVDRKSTGAYFISRMWKHNMQHTYDSHLAIDNDQEMLMTRSSRAKPVLNRHSTVYVIADTHQFTCQYHGSPSKEYVFEVYASCFISFLHNLN